MESHHRHWERRKQMAWTGARMQKSVRRRIGRVGGATTLIHSTAAVRGSGQTLASPGRSFPRAPRVLHDHALNTPPPTAYTVARSEAVGSWARALPPKVPFGSTARRDQGDSTPRRVRPRLRRPLHPHTSSDGSVAEGVRMASRSASRSPSPPPDHEFVTSSKYRRPPRVLFSRSRVERMALPMADHDAAVGTYNLRAPNPPLGGARGRSRGSAPAAAGGSRSGRLVAGRGLVSRRHRGRRRRPTAAFGTTPRFSTGATGVGTGGTVFGTNATAPGPGSGDYNLTTPWKWEQSNFRTTPG